MCSFVAVAEENGRKAGAADGAAGRPRAPSPVSGPFAGFYDDAYSRAYAGSKPARSRPSGALLGLGQQQGTDGMTARPALKALLG